ncbi:exonuclease SbcCD subunit D [Scatolibacter rhodanostii]|uniref:exonuclease SbcCD subunit D n=1 Tax=Scatolibacter rhodanostii TaxID=2014781 RepID=UPI000C0700B9|nr:exonuclease SbcCD subunit D [Scatolibacter rhodanostii]
MKIFHTSDWHLGRMLYGRSLLEDQKYFLNKMLYPQLAEESPDLLIIAGDIYDRQIASTEAIQLFDHFLTQMTQLKIPVAIIAGNHDGAERMALAKELLRRSGVYISTNLDDAQVPITWEKDGEKAQIFLLPYLDPSVVRDYFQDDSLKGESACMRRAVALLKDKFEDGSTKVLVSHCFVAGSLTSDSESGLWVGGSAEVSADIWEDFDYVALGHLHKAQKAGKNGRYAGSPLKYSVDEQHHKKSFVKLNLTKANIETELVQIKPLREVRRISGEFSDLMKQAKENPTDEGKEDYVEIELLDKNPVLLAAERLREYYPNLLAVSNRWVAETAATQQIESRKQQDDLTIFTSFLSEICQMESGEAEEKWFNATMHGVREEEQ